MKKLVLILFFSCLLPCLGISNNYADKKYYLIDSLDLSKVDPSEKELLNETLEKFHKAKLDSNKIKALSYFIENSWDDNLWPKYNNWIYKFTKQKIETSSNSEKLFLQKAYAQSLSNKGYKYMVGGHMDEALAVFNESIAISRSIDDELGVCAVNNNLAGIYEMQGKIEDALKLYESTLSILKKYNQDKNIGPTLNNIAAIYDNLGDNKIALDYYKESLKYYQKVGDLHGMSVAYNNIGLLYSGDKKLEEALIYYKKSLEILDQNKSDKKGIATTTYNIGEIYYSMSKYDTASIYFNKTLKLFEQIGARQGMSNCYRSLGKIYYENNENKKALELFNKSFVIANELGYPSTISLSAQSLSMAYIADKKWGKALELYKLHIKMEDSLNNESTQKAAIQQQAKFEYEKQKAVNDAEYEKEIAIEQEAKEKQTILTYATGGGLGLVAIFLLVVFNRLKVTRKQKNIIEEQKNEVEKQKTVVELAHTELEEKNKEITDSIQYAKRIQNAILPPTKLVKEYLSESFIYYQPKDIVAGDFYWMEPLKNGVLFAAADCTGHGVPGAMVSVVCNNGLNRSVREYGLTDPGEILNKTREIVVQEFEKSEDEVKDGMDIAICLLEGNKLQYAGAHNPLWLIRNGELLETKANKQPIGKFDNPEPYTTHSIDLLKGDSLYIFSDGYADQFGGEKGKKLKTTNFKKLLISIQKETMDKQRQLISEAFEDWKGELEQLDDICVIGVKI